MKILSNYFRDVAMNYYSQFQMLTSIIGQQFMNSVACHLLKNDNTDNWWYSN